MAEAVNCISPSLAALLTMAVAAPLNNSISGFWNDIRQVGSPLAVASNVPAPDTEKLTIRLSVGMILPSLSATWIVIYTRSSPSATRLFLLDQFVL